MTPDFAVSMPGGYRANANGHALPPILLVVEVLSPGQNLAQMRLKAHRYLAWGSQVVWLIDSETASAITFSADTPAAAHLVLDDTLRAGDLAVSLERVLAS